MLQNQLCENININNENFSISNAIVVENVSNKHQKMRYSKPQHTTPESSTCRESIVLFESESVLEN